ncbi:MAG: hypothetical protein OXB97_12740 [Rhodospirillales bacterium]|nr:hypothetical protein [Rhodospirillales bacterium]
MRLDRDLQLGILQLCRDSYPDRARDEDLPDHPELQANLIYLHEHDLIIGTLINGNVELRRPQITAAGLDFLEDDGGVSAMLRTITVKIDQDNLRALIAARVANSDLPAADKDRLSRAIRSLPAQALRDLTTRLVNDAVNQWPGALQLFQTCVGPS